MTLIGRTHQVQVLLELLENPSVRLVNLTGPAGVGKTRLALELLDRVGDRIPIHKISFATLPESRFFAARMGASLGIAPLAAESWEARIIDHLQDTKLLMLLDNLEQILPIPFLPRLLSACPDVQLLTTSRVVLHLSDEHMLRVPPLSLPPEDAELSVAELLEVESIQLLLQRAKRVDPGFTISNENAADLATLVRSLDGLPLALELAAARLNTFGPAAMSARLNDSLALLVGGPLDKPEHQRTLRGTIAWSYQLLPERQQRLFRRLSVLNGAASPEFAMAVCSEPDDSLEDLIHLAECSLVQLSPGEVGRCSLLQTVRIFARQEMESAGESDEIHLRLAEFCLKELTALAPDLIGEQQSVAVAAIDSLLPNILGSLNWLQTNDLATTFTRLACSMFRYWRIRGQLSSAEFWMDIAIAPKWDLLHTRQDLALALVTSGWIALERGKPDTAQDYAERALTMTDGENDARIIGQAWRVLALVDNRQDQRDRATRRMETSLEWYRRADDADGIAGALNNLAILALDDGDWERVISLCEQSTAAFTEQGNIHGASHSLDTMGIAQYELGRYDDAMLSTLASLKIDRSVGDSRGLAITLDHVGKIARARGDLPSSWEAHAESLMYRQQVGDPRGMLVWLQAMAHWLVDAGRAEIAGRILGTLEIARTSMNLPIQHHEMHDHTTITESVRRLLGEERFTTAVAKGRWASLESMTAEAEQSAIARVQEIVAGASILPDGIGEKFGLTEREEEVFHLLARRLSDREIADQLSISARTVNRHVSNLLAKLDVRSRREAALMGSRESIG